MRYEIDNDSFAVKIYDGINPEPFWFQPDYPNGDKFNTYTEAEEWAKLAILSQDSSYEFFAPNGKGIQGERKPTEAQLLEAKLSKTGLTVDDLKTLLGLN
jgi:hypothetical protein